ncbi:MAG TPA: formimidoylglutamase [Edaphocola sp.]|nr:formimidoylglutamase [Edaphocola sp.]
MHDISEFLSPKHYKDLLELYQYNNLQFAQTVDAAKAGYLDFSQADIVLVGCGELRGENFENINYSDAPNVIRKAFYELYNWFPNIAIADLGNIIQGATLSDTRVALKVVLSEIKKAGKIAIVLGGSQDLTLQQYEVFKENGELVEVSVLDSLIDLEEGEAVSPSRGFLMDMLTGEPNYVKHYNHIGFQSYFTHPKMLETLDKLRFDFHRLGKVRGDLDDMEPVLRSTNLLSVDMNVVRACDAPFNHNASPNGLFGDEICQLIRYAGMSTKLTSLGIYGYYPENDINESGAKLIAQMLWYFIDGYRVRLQEVQLRQTDSFLSYHVPFAQYETQFLQSKITNRWWLQLPDGQYIPCSEKDYKNSTENEVPERWLRAQERLT